MVPNKTKADWHICTPEKLIAVYENSSSHNLFEGFVIWHQRVMWHPSTGKHLERRLHPAHRNHGACRHFLLSDETRVRGERTSGSPL